MDWEECLTKKIARQAQVDGELIASLQQSSENKLASSKLLPLDTITSASKISLSYDALRELLEAVALRKEYKIYNHECYTGFVKTVLGDQDMAARFDRIRLLRNSINYYGQNISIEETKESIKEIEALIIEVKRLLE